MDNVSVDGRDSERSMAHIRANFTRIELGHSDDEVRDLMIEIGLLKQEVKGKDEEISRLNQELENLKAENRAVKASLNLKNKEINGLKLEIKNLQAEKKKLEDRLTHVQAEVGTLNTKVGDLSKEVANLKEENAGLQGDNLALEEKVENLESTVTDMKTTFQSINSANVSLTKKVNALEFRRSHEALGSKFPALESSKSDNTDASLILGELCREIPSLIYQKVLPSSFDPTETYHIKFIEEDIESLEDEEEKKLAGETWAELQKELGWESKLFARTMKTIKVQRNMTAHPEINEALLRQSAKLMIGKMYGPGTFESVKKLIGIWKKLVETVKQ